MSDSSQPHGLQPTRLVCPWDFPGKSTGVGCHCLLRKIDLGKLNMYTTNFNKIFKYLKEIKINYKYEYKKSEKKRENKHGTGEQTESK